METGRRRSTKLPPYGSSKSVVLTEGKSTPPTTCNGLAHVNDEAFQHSAWLSSVCSDVPVVFMKPQSSERVSQQTVVRSAAQRGSEWSQRTTDGSKRSKNPKHLRTLTPRLPGSKNSDPGQGPKCETTLMAVDTRTCPVLPTSHDLTDDISSYDAMLTQTRCFY